MGDRVVHPLSRPFERRLVSTGQPTCADTFDAPYDGSWLWSVSGLAGTDVAGSDAATSAAPHEANRLRGSCSSSAPTGRLPCTSLPHPRRTKPGAQSCCGSLSPCAALRRRRNPGAESCDPQRAVRESRSGGGLCALLSVLRPPGQVVVPLLVRSWWPTRRGAQPGRRSPG